MFKEITKDNWLEYAKDSYDSPHKLTSEEEFDDDIKRLKYHKRLFRRYSLTGEL